MEFQENTNDPVETGENVIYYQILIINISLITDIGQKSIFSNYISLHRQ